MPQSRFVGGTNVVVFTLIRRGQSFDGPDVYHELLVYSNWTSHHVQPRVSQVWYGSRKDVGATYS